MRTMLALAMAVALVTGCSDDLDIGDGGNASVTVVGSGEVDLAAGGELKVALAANPSTGYTWEVSVTPDPAVLEQVGESVYEPTPTDTMVVGSGGTMTFEFRATGAGTTTVELVYRRPWEEGVEPVETVTLDVTVD
jgi:inhibitor of cysteine peptidase